VENAEQKVVVDPAKLEKVKVQIAKLKAMAADASSPYEAGIAEERYRKLMDQYQLDEFDISGKIDEVMLKMDATGFFSAIPQYMSTLAVSVARFNDCHVKYNLGQNSAHAHKSGSAIQFMGFKSDVEMAVDMYKRLVKTIDRFCKEYMTKEGYKTYDPKIGGQFKIGCSDAIRATIQTMIVKRDLLTSEQTGTSLVLAKTKLVEEHFGPVRYQSTKERKINDSEQRARAQGYIKGSTVEVAKKVG
jgi:hypothetical protein